MNHPTVTVVCLSYQHREFVEEALNSVFTQTYQPIELIVVDDASTDRSQERIREVLKDKPAVRFIANQVNQGNCKAFNSALSYASGKYIIDLAADDVMYPDRIEQQVQLFESLSEEYAVVFSDTHFINEAGDRIGETFYKRNREGVLEEKVPSGNIYTRLLQNPPMISPPTQMFRTAVLKAIGGYDASLSYEDYDFWVRTGKYYKYAFLDSVTTAKRELPYSHGKAFYNKRRNQHLWSTLKVSRKAQSQNELNEENKALAKSVRYHIRLAFFTENFEVGEEFAKLLKELEDLTPMDRLFVGMLAVKLPLNWFYSKIRG
ncbi:glycosyltransferase family A protein [Limibacter armeniacum]|uniref:glycosyltransferase family 2 protein n=1 Tax=Limibacter armeniacum TaxID=466084 RepID=UPI002FE63B32